MPTFNAETGETTKSLEYGNNYFCARHRDSSYNISIPTIAGFMQRDTVSSWTTTSWWEAFFSSTQVTIFSTGRWQVTQMCSHSTLGFSTHCTGTISILTLPSNDRIMSVSWFESYLCILIRAHIAWVYSYGLSLARGFTFAMTLVSTLANVLQLLFVVNWSIGHYQIRMSS